MSVELPPFSIRFLCLIFTTYKIKQRASVSVEAQMYNETFCLLIKKLFGKAERKYSNCYILH